MFYISLAYLLKTITAQIFLFKAIVSQKLSTNTFYAENT